MEESLAGRASTILTSLKAAREKTNSSAFDLFSKFVSVCEAALSSVKQDEWEQHILGMEDVLPEFQVALGELMYQSSIEFCDLLGYCYMKLGHSDNRLGQFITPWPAAKFLAKLTYDS